jgi:hypothetical protein
MSPRLTARTEPRPGASNPRHERYEEDLLSSTSPEESPPQGGDEARPRSDRSPWNWLLILPVVVPLITLFYNFDEPRLAGFPAFYWIQMLLIPLSVLCTVLVYRATRRRG